MAECPVCKIDRADVCTYDGGGGKQVVCPRCGRFRIKKMGEFDLEHGSEEWPMRVACLLRHADLYGDREVELTRENLPSFEQGWREHSVSEKQDALLLALAKMSKYPGYPVPLNRECDHVLAWCDREEEFDYHLQTLTDRGLVAAPTMEPVWIITPAGWDRIAQIGAKAHVSTDLVFVAMTFDPALSTAWTDGLQPGIAAAGYRPERVDTGHHAGKIDDRIMAMIREARFVVVDVTTQNRGAYFEAGFALGLDRQVIWSVRENDLANVHFDTRQFNHVVWTDPADLRDKIRDRVLGVFGRGPAQ